MTLFSFDLCARLVIVLWWSKLFYVFLVRAPSNGTVASRVFPFFLSWFGLFLSPVTPPRKWVRSGRGFSVPGREDQLILGN